MKKFVIIVILLSYWVSSAQTTAIGFTQEKVNFDLSKKTLTVEVEIKNAAAYKSKDSISFEIVTKTPKVIDSQGPILRVVNPKKSKSPIIIHIPIKSEEAKKEKVFFLEITQKVPSKSYNISQNKLTVVSIEKPKEEFSIGIEKLDDASLEVDIEDSIIFRFNINSKGYRIKKEDNLILQMKFEGASEGNKPIEQITQDITYQYIEFKKGEENYTKIKDALTKNNSLTLEVSAIKNDGNKNITGKIEDDKKTIKYNLKKRKRLKNKYDIFLGSNFDIVKEFSSSKFYAEFDVFLPNLINDKFGVRGGIYKNNTSTKLEQDQQQETILSRIDSPTDSISFERKRISSTPNVSVENLGLFVEGMIPIHRDENLSWFIGVHLEIIQRLETYSFDNVDLITLETNTISLDSLANDRRLQEQLSRPSSFTRRYVDSYFGISVPMFYSNSNANGKGLEVMVNPSIGVGDPGLIRRRRENNPIKMYGMTQFHLIFGSDSGVKFKIGGEVRKYFNFFQDPIITINFSAAVNLEEVFKTGD